MESGNIYKKITRDDVDFPRYCFFFIKEIQDSIEEYEIKDPGDELEVVIETYSHPYCYDAFALVVKAFERKNFQVKIPTFKMEKGEGDSRLYIYKWNLKKINPCDDLPF